MIGYPFITFIYPLEFKAKKAYYENLYSLLRTTYVAGWIGRCNFFYRHSIQPPPPPPRQLPMEGYPMYLLLSAPLTIASEGSKMSAS